MPFSVNKANERNTCQKLKTAENASSNKISR